jgi:predicted GIY-YIG superfamily endonuclease
LRIVRLAGMARAGHQSLSEPPRFGALRDSACYVYCIGSEGHDKVKIGISKRVAQRLKEVQTHYPDRLEIFWQKWFPTRAEALRYEKGLHDKLGADKCFAKEWFRISPEDFLKKVS